MYAVVIFPYTKSIRVIPVKWVLNFDKKNIEKNTTKVCYYNKNLEKNQIWTKRILFEVLSPEQQKSLITTTPVRKIVVLSPVKN
jgi:hypothetical protein